MWYVIHHLPINSRFFKFPFKVLQCKRNTLRLTEITSHNVETHSQTSERAIQINKVMKRSLRRTIKNINSKKDSNKLSSSGCKGFFCCSRKSESGTSSQNIEANRSWTNTTPSSTALSSNKKVSKGSLQCTEHNYKAFLTIMVLTGVLVFCWVPFFVVSFVMRYDISDSVQWSLSHVKFYYIELLPLVSYMLDPIVFGLRIKPIRESYKRLFCAFKSCKRSIRL